MGILLMLGAVAIAILTAILFHRMFSSYWIAVLVSGPFASAVFQTIVFVATGQGDEFFPIGFMITAGVAWAVSGAVGLVMRRMRKRRALQ